MSHDEMLQAALHHQRGGRFDEAVQGYRFLLHRNPHDVNALHLLGTVQLQRGAAHEAVRCIRQAIELRPQFAMAHANLGVALRSDGDVRGAIESYRRALDLNPVDATTWLNLSVALSGLRRFSEALDACDRALALRSLEPKALVARAHALLQLCRYEDALQAFELASQQRPMDGALHLACARILLRGGRPAQALAACARARELDEALRLPADALLFARMQLCDWSTRFEDAQLADNRDLPAPMAPTISLGLHDDPGLHLSTAVRWANNLLPQVPVEPALRTHRLGHSAYASSRRLRLGYLSADFRDHVVTHALVRLLECHDRDQFELTALSLSGDDASHSRVRLRAAMDDCLDLSTLGDAAAALAIRERGIDVLLDLGGFSADARPGILLHRAAPLQVSYLGYPSTMGTRAVDYLICDRQVIPEQFEADYCEQLARLPECFMPYDTSRSIAEAAPTRAQQQLPESALVLCSFNASWKIDPRVFDVWMRLLHQLPDSVLWLRDNEEIRGNLRREAAARDVAPERLVFAHRESDPATHLARHRLADLFLDTWPYNAHQTACDALWAGLPVLTYAGCSFPSRVAGSLLHAADVPELVCTGLGEYERRALELAHDRAQLESLRVRIRAARDSVLFDMPRLCRHLEYAYRQMWHRHEHEQPPLSFSVDALPRHTAG
jgi:protein O-GlcNAc transferase